MNYYKNRDGLSIPADYTFAIVAYGPFSPAFFVKNGPTRTRCVRAPTTRCCIETDETFFHPHSADI